MPRKVTDKAETAAKKRAPRGKRATAREEAAPSTAAATQSVAAVAEEQIRARAYLIFRSGVNPSDPVADWFQAERELQSEAGAA